MSDELTDAQIVELEQALRALARELEAGLDANSDSADVVDLDQPIGRV